jgi:hypothetical protein
MPGDGGRAGPRAGVGELAGGGDYNKEYKSLKHIDVNGVHIPEVLHGLGWQLVQVREDAGVVCHVPQVKVAVQGQSQDHVHQEQGEVLGQVVVIVQVWRVLEWHSGAVEQEMEEQLLVDVRELETLV